MTSPTTAVKSSPRARANSSASSFQKSVMALSFRISGYLAGCQQVGARAPGFRAHRLAAIGVGSFRVGAGGDTDDQAVPDVAEVDRAPSPQSDRIVGGRQDVQAHELEHAIGE